jgi:hypothetical protein
MQAAATRPTPQQPGQETGPPSHRAAHHQPLHLRIVAHESQNLLVGVPGNIGVVVVGEQGDPLLPRPAVAAGLVRLAVDHGRAGFGAPEGIGPRVERIGQELQDRVVHGQSPRHPFAPGRITIERGQRHLLLTKPQERLAHAADLGELGEDELDGVLDPLIGMLLDAAVTGLNVANGEAEDQGPSPRLRQQALVGPLPNPPQLRLADRALQAEQEPVVELARIIDAFRVHNQGVHQPA